MSSYVRYLKSRAEETRVDLTPMLDVVFILLIFFVVTTIQLDESSLPLQSQEALQAEDPPDEASQNILITISDDNRVSFNGVYIENAAVRPRVLQVLARNPDASVLVRPDGNSRADILVTVVNAARSAGVENVRVSE